MQITNVRIKKPPEEFPRLKALASIAFDDQLFINEVGIYQADKGLCVDFPRGTHTEKTKSTIGPMNQNFREYIESIVLKAYRLGCDYFLREDINDENKSSQNHGNGYTAYEYGRM